LNRFIPPEINVPEPGAILAVGRDLGQHEVRQGRPFVGRAGHVLDEALSLAGIRRSEINITNVVLERPPGNVFARHREGAIETGLFELRELVETLRPSVIVALGNEASHALVENWPDSRIEGQLAHRGKIKSATSIEDRRGYVWTTEKAPCPVVSTIHPAAVDRIWVPWAPLLTRDLERTRLIHQAGLRRPKRNVRIVADPVEATIAIRAAGLVGCDIENFHDPQKLRCVGFATSPTEAWVFPPGERFRPYYTALLEDPKVEKVFANGQYDRYFLRTREGIETRGHAHDTQLAWHAIFPELAGKSDWKGVSVSRKSLKFLASLFTLDEWWKDYEFENEEECYLLNGLDCCITLDIVRQLTPTIEEREVERTYRLEIDLVDPCMEMQENGCLLDDRLRLERFEKLDERIGELNAKVVEVVRVDVEKAVSEGRVEQAHLFTEKWTCPCCRNGRKKREHCHDCADIRGSGQGGSILVGDLVNWAEGRDIDEVRSKSKQELIDLIPPCSVCSGDGQRESFTFNANSVEQKKILLYEIWRLPPRYHDQKLSVREDKVKALLVHCRAKKWEEREGTLDNLLWISRCAKLRGDYRSIAPGEDGRIRTVLSPSGTETGRLSHGSTFLEPSRNLANMAHKRAGLDPLFRIRNCFIPSPGMALIEADLSQVEGRFAAYMADEPTAISEYEEGIDRYRKFASRLYSVDYEEVPSEQRHVGKTAVLSLQYGTGWKTFLDMVNGDEELTGVEITAAVAKRAVGLFHEIYPFYRRWYEAVVREAERNGGWLRTPMGRRRDFFGRTDSQGARDALRREMVAFLGQSTAVDLFNTGLLRVRKRVRGLRLLLQIHDAILGEVREERVGEVAKQLVEALTIPVRVGEYEVTIPVEVKTSTENWGEMHEIR